LTGARAPCIVVPSRADIEPPRREKMDEFEDYESTETERMIEEERERRLGGA